MTVFDKIESFSKLPDGWHYGAGKAAPSRLVAAAKLLAGFFPTLGFTKLDAFPGIDGEIMVSAYDGKDCIEITAELDGSYRFAHERDNDTVAYQEGLTLTEVAHRLLEAGDRRKAEPEEWHLFGSFIQATTTWSSVSSRTWHFGLNENSGGVGGVSCFEEDCAIRTSNSVCEHARRFYGGLAFEPPIFWIFNQSALPTGSRVEQRTENSDGCHHNILDASGTALRKIPKSWAVSDLRVCDPHGERPLSLDDLRRFHATASDTHDASRSG